MNFVEKRLNRIFFIKFVMDKIEKNLRENAGDIVDGAFWGAFGTITGAWFDYAYTGGLIGTGLTLICNPEKRGRRFLGSLCAASLALSSFLWGNTIMVQTKSIELM